jgi:hypothetical protein
VANVANFHRYKRAAICFAIVVDAEADYLIATFAKIIEEGCPDN